MQTVLMLMELGQSFVKPELFAYGVETAECVVVGILEMVSIHSASQLEDLLASQPAVLQSCLATCPFVSETNHQH